MSTEMLFENLAFCYPFRDYQSRVLSQIDYLFQDKKLHIVAAPGSGKTVLGLEVIRQLKQKTLILVPTINLRNQWKDRLFDLFIPKDNEDLRKEWEQEFSMDLKHPKTITCTTYQALYYLYKEKQDEGDGAFAELIRTYRVMGMQTICLDEAHHLKQEWWKALTEFVKTMNVKVISLTATPPMDTSDTEWKRYMDLCGEIDQEINIPEMVVKKCLCPHQDYLYLCEPSKEEQEKVEKELTENAECRKTILRDKELYEAIKQLPFLRKPSKYTNLLVKNPDYLEHIVKYVSYIKEKYHIELEGSLTKARMAFVKWDHRIKNMIPKEPDYDVEEWFLPLMRDVLENDADNYPSALRGKIFEILKKNHFIKNGKVSEYHTAEKLNDILVNSVSKLDAIVDIVQIESKSMEKDLRCLILMDHIRKEDLKKIETEEPLTDLGVVTIFERLRRQEHMGNLENYFHMDNTYRTRLGVMTGSLIILPDAVMDKLEAEQGLGGIKKLGLTGYSMLEGSANSADSLVATVTKYFERGLIEILIGTAALLGEGWDAPAVNTLIIGSTSSMYVKTNQMRGRALRINSQVSDKVSNIWHLMTATCPIKKSPELRSVSVRFDAILGLSMDGTRVESRIDRIIEPGQSLEYAGPFNAHMEKKACDREFVKNAWTAVEDNYTDFCTRNVVLVERKPDFRSRTKWLSEKQLRKIAKAIVKTLILEKQMHPEVVLKCKKQGTEILFYLESATEHDSRLFANCMKQAAVPLHAPKYMMRTGRLSKRYFAVPDALAGKKDIANLFSKRLGMGYKLVYVRSKEGEQMLLKGKLKQHTAKKRSVSMIKELL